MGNVIERLSGVNGLVLEMVGTWLWISGDTKTNKELLKELGCKWSPKRLKWCYHEGAYRKFSKRTEDFEVLKETYGYANLSANQ